MTSSSWAGAVGLNSPIEQQALETSRAAILRPWFDGVGNRHFARANGIVLGDSKEVGQGASSQANRFISRLNARLRASLPSDTLGSGGGRGYISAANTGETTFTWPAGTGSVLATSSGVGPNSSVVGLSTGAHSKPFSLTCTSADIIVGPGGVGWYSWDGGTTKTTFNTAGLVDGTAVRATPSVAGVNTLTCGWSSGGTVFLDGVVEYNGDENAGITVHDGGHFGWTTQNWINNVGWAGAVAALNPLFVGIDLGVNDLNAGISPAQFSANLVTMIAALRAVPALAAVPVILLASAGVYNATPAFTWAQYVTQMYQVAVNDGNALVFDFSLRLNPPATAGAGNFYDTVHYSNQGASRVADMLSRFLQPV